MTRTLTQTGTLPSANPNIRDVHTRHCSVDRCKYGEGQPVYGIDPEDGEERTCAAYGIECTVVSGRGVPESLDNGDLEWGCLCPECGFDLCGHKHQQETGALRMCSNNAHKL